MIRRLAHIQRWVAFAGVVPAMAILAPSVPAQEPVVISKATVTTAPIEMVVGHSSVLLFDQPVDRVLINDSSIADVVVVSPTQVLMHGRRSGSTSVIVWRSEQSQLLTVTVEPDLASIRQTIRRVLPGEAIEVDSAASYVVLSGEVSSDDTVAQALAIAESYSARVTNLLTTSTKQVLIAVRFAEVDRSVSRSLGFDYIIQDKDFTQSGFIGGGLSPQVISTPEHTRIENSSDVVLGSLVNQFFEMRTGPDLTLALIALEEEGLLRILAEPNLLAMSGEEASFLAGGEFPIPVVQSAASSGAANNAVTIEFKEFGIRLNFLPTVMHDNTIRVFVEPEVSVLDFGPAAVKLGGFEVPGLVTRRASTTVQMNSGESLIIGGLLSQIDTRTEGRIPWLGNVPILGKLFSSEKFKQEETELLVLVTPWLVKPRVTAQAMPYADPQAVEEALDQQIGPSPYPDHRGGVLRDVLDPTEPSKEAVPISGAVSPEAVGEEPAATPTVLEPVARVAPEPVITKATSAPRTDAFKRRANAVTDSIDAMRSELEQEVETLLAAPDDHRG